MYLISIIVPVYNVEQFLPRCIESILNQTYKNIEVILVNDGSTDNSGKICEEYKIKDSRIKVIHQENQGVSVARNTGIENSKGEFIGFIDSDDYIDDDMYELLIKNIIKDDVDISICGFKQIELNGDLIYNFENNRNEIFNNIEVIDSFFSDDYFKQLMYAPWNKIYRKELLEKVRFDSNLSIGEDILFVFMCVDLAKKIGINDMCKYNYVVRKNSAMTSKFSEKRFDYIKAFEKIKDICSEKYEQVSKYLDLMLYVHKLNICRQLHVLKNDKLYEREYIELKNYLKSNKSLYYKELSFKKKINYNIMFYVPSVYSIIYMIKNKQRKS